MNIEEKINDLQKQIENHNNMMNQQIIELQKLISEQNNTTKEVVEPKSVQELVIGDRKHNERYYAMNNYFGNIENNLNDFHFTDERLYETFNYFQNKTEAEKYLRLAYLNNKMIRIRNYVNNGWIIDNYYFFAINLYFNDKEDCHIVDGINGNTSPLFFETYEKALEFEKLVDVKELIEYLQLMEGYTPESVLK